MHTLILIAAAVIAGFYIVVPLLLWISGSRIPPIEWQVLEANAAVPAPADAHFWKTTAVLSSSGFDRAGGRVRETMSNGMANYAQLWRNAETGEAVYVATTLKHDGAAYCQSFVVLLHEGGNGGLITTSNFQPPARMNLDPVGASRISVPGADIATLRALHRGHLAVVGGRPRPIRMRDGLTLCQALDATTRTTALTTNRFRASGDTLRITFAGAFYSIWINLPPLKSMYERRDKALLVSARALESPSQPPEYRAA